MIAHKKTLPTQADSGLFDSSPSLAHHLLALGHIDDLLLSKLQQTFLA